VTTGPGDGTAARSAGHGHLRASHADREQVIDVLKAAFVRGMLTKDEFDGRVGQVLASRTYAELGVVTADIPTGPIAAEAPRPALVQPPASVTDTKPAARIIATATAVPAGLWAYVIFAPGGHVDHGGIFLLVTASTFVWLMVLLLIGVDMLISWQQKRSGAQVPPRPASGAGDRPGHGHAPGSRCGQ
jgi:uncharacterized membrane protein